jgi:hypothetical protein
LLSASQCVTSDLAFRPLLSVLTGCGNAACIGLRSNIPAAGVAGMSGSKILLQRSTL